MRQALHIFNKDARHLRWELGVSLLFLAAFVYTQVHRSILREVNAETMSYLLLAFWAFLCARLIQAEAIPGDRQFWVTRPYEWRSLLGAKLLFMVVFIGVPLLVADAVVLGMSGFSVASYLGGLLWSLILIIASTLVAFCAFATLTRGLTEWMLAAIVTVAVDYVIAVMANEKRWGGVEWIRDYGYVAIMFLVALVVLLGQYKRRRTMTYIVVMAVGLFGSSIFINYSRSSWAFELETRFSTPKVDPSPIRIAPGAAEHAIPHTDPSLGRQQVVVLAIPVDLSGLREGQDLISDEVRIAIRNDNGEIWSRQGRQLNGSNYLRHLLKGYDVLLQVDRPAFEKANGGAVDIRLTLYLTMLRDLPSRTIRAGAGAVDVPGVGRCQSFADEGQGQGWIGCGSPLRAPPNVLTVYLGDERRDRFQIGTSYSPFPADANSAIVPLVQYFHSGPRDSASAILTSLEPVAHFRRELDLLNVHLTDYQVSSPFER